MSNTNNKRSFDVNEETVFSQNAFNSDAKICTEIILALEATEDGPDAERVVEQMCERFDNICSKWQSMPQMIESHLHHLLSSLIRIVTNSTENAIKFHAAFRMMSRLTACVGARSLCRHFPTEVSWMQKVVDWSLMQDVADSQTWPTRASLLLWLSMAVKTPFALSSFDSGGDVNDKLIMKIYSIIDRFLSVGDKSRDSAAILASNFFSRPDVSIELLPKFMKGSLERISDLTATPTPSHMQTHLGSVIAVARLLKLADRKDMIKYAPNIIETGVKLDTCGHELVAKLKVKLIGRAALSLMPPRLAKWRYKRGRRLLAENLVANKEQANDTKELNDSKVEEEEEEDYDIPDEIELILDSLLTALRDASTNVRWSAAKYVARVTNRLPKTMASDVVSHVLQICDWRDSDSSWHGACLSLAELARRGLILPQQLDEVVELTIKALTFDEIKGSFSVGSHVRDSACFVCWSLARAYDSSDIQLHVRKLAPTLISVSCFDREINCRRAASAAIQELVGRTQTFPHGIDVVLLTEFHSLANRNHCYLEIAYQLASKEEFGIHLVKHLLQKTEHWDEEIREISSRSLGRLSSIVKIEEFIPELISKCVSHDLNARHGAILAIAEIILGINGVLKPQILDDVALIAHKLIERQLLRGLGGEYMKRALCVLIARCSQTCVEFNKNTNSLLSTWTDILCESITSEDAATRKEAVEAICAFSYFYLQSEDNNLKEKIIEHLYTQLSSSRECARIGASHSLSVLPIKLIESHWEKFILLLISNINSRDVLCDSRAAQITSFIELVLKFGSIDGERIDQIVDSLCLSMDDRTNDSRGDIGGAVRMAAIQASTKLVYSLNKDQVNKMLIVMSTECFSKWKKVREIAINAFKEIVYNETIEMQGREEIKEKFDEAYDDLIAFFKLLQMEPFTYSLLKGLVTSIADATETQFRHLLHQELKVSSSLILNKFVELFKDHVQCDRLSHCCITTAHFLLTSCETNDSFQLQILSFTWDAVRKSSDIRKLASAIDVFCSCLLIGTQINKSLSYLTIFLCHRYPRVRSLTASQMYIALMACDDVNEEVLQLLTDTDWNQHLDQVRAIRDSICDLMGIAKPKKITPKTS